MIEEEISFPKLPEGLHLEVRPREPGSLHLGYDSLYLYLCGYDKELQKWYRDCYHLTIEDMFNKVFLCRTIEGLLRNREAYIRQLKALEEVQKALYLVYPDLAKGQ